MKAGLSLVVNGEPITLDFFVGGYVEKVVGGIVSSLKGTGKIETLRLSIDSAGTVAMILNGADVSLNDFTIEIIRSTILGMIAPLKGAPASVESLEITIGL